VPRGCENEGPLPDRLAYFLTWCTYGTWLPGNERGWVLHRRGWQLPDPVRELEAKAKMAENACRLNARQREVVEQQISETCEHRGWALFAVNCRSNHLHVVLFSPQKPEFVRNQLKAWCTRRLKELEVNQHLLELAEESQLAVSPRTRRGVSKRNIRESWWAERGSV
jgi:REP element-mobilizing transposase RayT